MNKPAAFGRTIQLFLVNGAPGELMIATIHGWTGSVLVASQSTLSALIARPEVDRTGIYILYGPDPDDPLKMRAYVGEADSVRTRIAQSVDERTFWETAVVVTTSDEALNKGHVRYLEARLIERAAKAGRVTLDNVQEPSTEKRRLSEADRANMEAFLANLETILPVIGLDLLKQAVAVPQAQNKAVEAEPWPATTVFEIRHRSGVTAEALEQGDEFIVLVGSQALAGTDFAPSSYGRLKRELLMDGILTEAESGRYIFAKPYAFRSPSAAAAVVLDRNSNGRIEWKVKGSQQSYHDWQQAEAVKASPRWVNAS